MATMLRDIVIFRMAHGPTISVASHADHEKRVAWFSKVQGLELRYKK